MLPARCDWPGRHPWTRYRVSGDEAAPADSSDQGALGRSPSRHQLTPPPSSPLPLPSLASLPSRFPRRVAVGLHFVCSLPQPPTNSATCSEELDTSFEHA